MDDPFEELQIDTLSLPSDRLSCPNCKRSHSLFCPSCNIPLAHNPPHVSLPVPLTIIRHPAERLGKTTSTHAKLIAPDKVSIHIQHPSDPMQLQFNPSRSLLLFPSPNALPLSQIQRESFDTLIVIDGTWKQAKSIANSLESFNITHVRISSHETLFWRYQSLDRTYLATIEAIYWFFRDYYDAYSAQKSGYDGRFDNLLFYFKHSYQLIQEYYKKNPHLTFTSKHADGSKYIHYTDESTAE